MTPRRSNSGTRALRPTTPLPDGFEMVAPSPAPLPFALSASAPFPANGPAGPLEWAQLVQYAPEKTPGSSEVPGLTHRKASGSSGTGSSEDNEEWEDLERVILRRRKEDGKVIVASADDPDAGDALGMLDLGSFLDEMDKAAGGDGVTWREALTNRHVVAFPPAVHVSAVPFTNSRPSTTYSGPRERAPIFASRPKSAFTRRGSTPSVLSRRSSTHSLGSGPSPISASVRRRSIVGAPMSRRLSIAAAAATQGGGAGPSSGAQRRASAAAAPPLPGGRRLSGFGVPAVPRSFSVDSNTFRRRSVAKVSPAGKGEAPLVPALSARRASAPGPTPRRPSRPVTGLFDTDAAYDPGVPQAPKRLDTDLLPARVIAARRISISGVRPSAPVAEPMPAPAAPPAPALSTPPGLAPVATSFGLTISAPTGLTANYSFPPVGTGPSWAAPLSRTPSPTAGHPMARRPSVVPRVPVPAYAVLAAELGLDENLPAQGKAGKALAATKANFELKALGIRDMERVHGDKMNGALPELPQVRPVSTFGSEFVMGVAM